MDVGESAVEGRELTGKRPPLLRVLMDARVASEEQLRLAFAEAVAGGERFGEVVLRHGWLDEAGLARALARQWGLPYVESDAEVDHDATRLFSAALGEELGACPVLSPDEWFLVAVAEPSEERFAAVHAATAAEPAFAVVTASTLERLLVQAAETAEDAQSARAEPRVASAADADQTESRLSWLDRELDAAVARLISLRERVVHLVAFDQRNERELAECRGQIAALSEARAADQERIRVLQTQLAQQQDLLAAVRATLADVSRILDT